MGSYFVPQNLSLASEGCENFYKNCKWPLQVSGDQRPPWSITLRNCQRGQPTEERSPMGLYQLSQVALPHAARRYEVTGPQLDF